MNGVLCDDILRCCLSSFAFDQSFEINLRWHVNALLYDGYHGRCLCIATCMGGAVTDARKSRQKWVPVAFGTRRAGAVLRMIHIAADIHEAWLRQKDPRHTPKSAFDCRILIQLIYGTNLVGTMLLFLWTSYLPLSSHECPHACASVRGTFFNSYHASSPAAKIRVRFLFIMPYHMKCGAWYKQLHAYLYSLSHIHLTCTNRIVSTHRIH